MKTPNQKDTAGQCEMCGHHVSIRQKAHICAEGPTQGYNLLLLCPTCHVMFDTHIKPKIFKALKKGKVRGLPKSWEKSIYDQAADASPRPRGWKDTLKKPS